MARNLHITGQEQHNTPSDRFLKIPGEKWFMFHSTSMICPSSINLQSILHV